MNLLCRFLLCIALTSVSIGSAELTHPELIRGWNGESLARGRALYESICITCHGTPEREGSLPSSRPFWKEPFKNGGDPFNMYRTLAEGLGQMPALTFLSPQQRYDVIQYIREAFVRPFNIQAYFPVSEAYLSSLPITNLAAGVTAEMVAFEKGPQYQRMDFGPVLFWTLQVASNNIAYKGIAIRLDEGPGGVSKGHAWIVYDHDTMRAAAGWTGDQFIDWRGIAFDGSHGTHASIVGDIRFVNPVGPGWAEPGSDRFGDPRFLGRDGKPYGPLPRDWVHYRGTYINGSTVVLSYSVGSSEILESPGYEKGTFIRTLNVGRSASDLLLSVAPASVPVSTSEGLLLRTNGMTLLRIAGEKTPLKLKLAVGSTKLPSSVVQDLSLLTHGGAERWTPPLATQGKIGTEEGPFAIDELTAPPDLANPWHTWMRFGGFDFFVDGRRAAICTWNGDVWIVSGIEGDLRQLLWKRIASGLFQPLGLKIVNEVIYVTCRDQIARLIDLNRDGETDYVENFNNDAQVTEHFHEFAMGLQTDREGNFYYAKSARHALPAIVPHHGTLLKVSKDGSRTEIVANGFRAANGVCVNDDGTFFVTDQEGHWTPKNRINLVRPGAFYGNMFGYHDQTSSADADMEQPVVWITNEMDRSPGELVRVTSERWGPLRGSLLNLSYGTGRIFLVLQEKIGKTVQGGVVQLPIPDFPTGVMRGRFHPDNGALYTCGMYAWAGNRQSDGGFYRMKMTGRDLSLPIALRTAAQRLTLVFTDPMDRASAENPLNFRIKVWGLQRSANYGSAHLNERSLEVMRTSLSGDAKQVELFVSKLEPTWCMEIKYRLRSTEGKVVEATIHNTIHALAGAN